jgi:hypothetical protein
MPLSPKALRFVVEALNYYLDEHDQRIRNPNASEDDRADWENGREFIEAIRQDCLDHLSQPAEQIHVGA